ncbi:MAG: MMPL family transporter [Candidatus Kuenenia sp.]|nr:MMPL family transporter [Candidatus Kuenenia hertensis]
MFEFIAGKIAAIVCSRPKIVIFVTIVLTVISSLYTVKYLKFNPDRNALISKEKEYNKRFLKLMDEFGQLDNHIIVLESENTDTLIHAAEEIAKRLKNNPHLIKDIFYKVNSADFEKKGLFYLDIEELHKIKKDLLNTWENGTPLANSYNYQDIFAQFDRSFAQGTNIRTGTSENALENVEHLTALLQDMIKSLRKNNAMPDISSQTGTQAPDGISFSKAMVLRNSSNTSYYNIFNNGHILLMEVEVNDIEGLLTATDSTNFIREQIAETKKILQGVDIGLTGTVAMEADEMEISQKEMLYISIGALVGVAILFIVSFNSIVMPLIGLLTLLCSISWTFGFTTLAIGYLNLFSIVFAVVLIGLGIDFSIHLILRYSEYRNLGLEKRDALYKSLESTGKGIILGAITTAISFYSTLLIDFKGLSELGMIAGTGILFALLSTLFFLSSLIILCDKSIIAQKKILPAALNFTIIKNFIHRIVVSVRVPLTIISLLFAIGSCFFIKHIKFDDNLLNLLPPNLESTKYAAKIVQSTGIATWFGAIVANTPEESEKVSERLKRLSSVGKVESIASVLPSRQEKKTDVIKELNAIARSIPFPEDVGNAIQYQELKNILERIQFRFTFGKNMGLLKEGMHPLIDRLLILNNEIDTFLRLAGTLPETEVVERLSNGQGNMRKHLEFLKHGIVSEPMAMNDLPYGLKERFVGRTGKNMVYLFPREDIWAEGKLDEFVSEIRSLQPEATGAPFQIYDTNKLIKKGFLTAGCYTMAIIFVILLFAYRKIVLTFSTLYPLILTILWTIGFMKLFRIQPNPANVIAFPLILGISIDNSIHTMLRINEKEGFWVYQTSTGKAIIVSSLTTIIGFGSLALASHRGISSLGLILVISLSCSLVTSIFVLPSTLSLIHNYKEKRTPRLYGKKAV